MKGKPPKEIRERRAQQPRKKTPPTPPTKSWDWKYWAALGITAAGTILGAIALLARPTASLDAPLDVTNVFTTPVVISNDGQLTLNEVGVIWYIRDIRYKNGGQINRGTLAGFVPPSPVLEPGEHKTIAYPRVVEIGSAPTSVDLVLAVYFKPAFWPFGKRHRLFRLLGAGMPNRGLRLQLQPADEVAVEVEQRLPQD
jgi:hypothetical protein